MVQISFYLHNFIKNFYVLNDIILACRVFVSTPSIPHLMLFEVWVWQIEGVVNGSLRVLLGH